MNTGRPPAQDRAKTIASYGSWPSPITADLLAERSIGLSELQLVGDDIYWLEGRPGEGGRSVVVRLPAGAGEPADLTPPIPSAVTPQLAPSSAESEPRFSVGSQVYEYGGGAWRVDDSHLYFTDEASGRLYRQSCDGGRPIPLTPAEQAGKRPARHYSDGLIDRPRKRWIGIAEDWTLVEEDSADPLLRYPRHTIVAVDASGSRLDPGTTIAEGHDCYSTPRLSPDGRMLAWLAWNLPHMPWEATTLFMLELDPDGLPASTPNAIAGGSGESIFQPEWSPDGATLWFVSDRTGWWNLYRYALDTRTIEPIAPTEAEFGRPQWNLGTTMYAFAGGGSVVASSIRQGLARLSLISPDSGEIKDIDLPFTAIGNVRADRRGRVAFTAAAARIPPSIVVLDLASSKWNIIRQTTDLADDPAIARHLSDVEPITYPTGKGEIAHALYYPPTSADFAGPSDEKPPLVVMSHGGPTTQATPSLKLSIQYWTSRGIAVLDVNYRGSSGYGRPYRDRLKESWGLVDVEDCIAGARYLAAKGLVDGDRAVITGGSAGGYTTLAALTFHDYFKAGASHYGIGDLVKLAEKTHKFESGYLDWLIGRYPEHIDRYRARSPINHVDRLECPVIFFQGDQDKVVPPDQSEAMFDALRRKGLPVGYLLFNGERHGFKHRENRRRAVEAEHLFFAFQVFRTKQTFDPPPSGPA